MLAENLMALASLAGRTLVAAAATDAWEAARRRFARLLGRGDPRQTQVAERRLDDTSRELVGASGADLEQARSALQAQWAMRLADLLDEDPGAAATLRALVEEIQAALPAGLVSAEDHSLAAGRDLNITASDGGIAAGVIHSRTAVGHLEYHRPEVTARPVRLPPRLELLAGREELLAELECAAVGR